MQPTYKIYIFLMTVIVCWSCQKEEDWRDKSPETLILGKWELVRDVFNFYGTFLVDEYIPEGYVEFLSKGRFAWYDYQTKEYTLFESKYVVENTRYSVSGPVQSEFWYLQHTNHNVYWRQRTMIGNRNPFSLPNCYNNQISFEDENTMIIHDNSVVLYFIYNRIK